MTSISAARALVTEFGADFKALGATPKATTKGVQLAFPGVNGDANAMIANALLQREVRGVPIHFTVPTTGTSPTQDAVEGALRKLPEVEEAHAVDFDFTHRIDVTAKATDDVDTFAARSDHLEELLLDQVQFSGYSMDLAVSEFPRSSGGGAA